jgi:hypothetical protein
VVVSFRSFVDDLNEAEVKTTMVIKKMEVAEKTTTVTTMAIRKMATTTTETTITETTLR